jgi:hypothetical protein
MRNLLALIGFAVVGFAGLGWYLNWFSIKSNPAPVGQKSYNIDINTTKISEDLHKGTTRVQELLDKNKPDVSAKAKSAAEEVKDAVKNALPELKKPFFDEESEEYPFDFRKPK